MRAPLAAMLALLPFVSVGDTEARDAEGTVNGEPTHLVMDDDVAAAEALLAAVGVRNGAVHIISDSPSAKPNGESKEAPADRGPLDPFEERRHHPAVVEKTGPSASLDHLEEESERRASRGLPPKKQAQARQLTEEEKAEALERNLESYRGSDNIIDCHHKPTF
jgi:hypothetical protein